MIVKGLCNALCNHANIKKPKTPQVQNTILCPLQRPPWPTNIDKYVCGKMLNQILLVSEAIMASLACKVARTLPAAPSRMLGVAVS